MSGLARKLFFHRYHSLGADRKVTGRFLWLMTWNLRPARPPRWRPPSVVSNIRPIPKTGRDTACQFQLSAESPERRQGEPGK